MKVAYLTLCLIACQTQTLDPATSATSQGLTFSNGNTVNLSAGNNNNVVFQGSSGLVYPDSSGSTITGVSLDYYGYGDILWIINESTSDYVTLTDDDTHSTAAYRLHLPEDKPVVVGPGRSYPLTYDYTNGWETLAGPWVRDVLSTSTPSRSLGTAFRPSTTNLTAVYYTAQVASAISLSGGASGRIELLSDSSNPPTTVRGRVKSGNTGTVVLGVSQTVTVEGELHYLVPIGDYVLLQSVTESGTPSFSLVSQAEQKL